MSIHYLEKYLCSQNAMLEEWVKQTKNAAAKRRTWSTVGQSLMASFCQSLSQNCSTAVLIFDDNGQINLSVNVLTNMKSFSPLYTSFLVRSASLSSKVKDKWGAQDNQTICLQLRQLFADFKYSFTIKQNDKTCSKTVVEYYKHLCYSIINYNTFLDYR